jgi:hypothetical protein
MSDPLPGPDFQNYERPNQKWICGHAAQGSPCRRGPDQRGRCGATAECAPVLEKKAGEEKGRWRCMRPGGACESGPLPDGSCGRPAVRCAPVPTLWTRRGQLTRAVVALTIALLLILLGGSWRGHFINPGALSIAHSGEKFARLHATNSATCAGCHKAGERIGFRRVARQAGTVGNRGVGGGETGRDDGGRPGMHEMSHESRAASAECREYVLFALSPGASRRRADCKERGWALRFLSQ